MAIDTNISYFKEDVGKNLYRKKTYYTLVVEQEVLANNKDEADKLFTDNGIDYSKIDQSITETKDGFQVQDMLRQLGIDKDFCQANAIKYLCRYGKKDGKNRKDLLKAIHYIILLMSSEDNKK